MRRTAVVAGLSGLALALGVPTLASGAAPPARASGRPDRTLGGGLGALVQGNGASTLRKATASKVRFTPEKLAMKDAQGRVLVDVTPQAGADAATFRKQV